MIDGRATAIVAGGMDGPEAVVWDPRGYLYAGGQDGGLHRVRLEDGTRERVADVGGRLLGMIVADDGSVIACQQDLAAVIRIDPGSGEWSVLSSGSPDSPMTTPNALAVAPDGELWITDSGIWGDDDGRLYRWNRATGTIRVDTDSTGYPNGVAISADGLFLYIVESRTPAVARYSLSSLDGSPVREVLVDCPRGSVPDGVSTCADGGVIVSYYEPDLVVRVHAGDAVELARGGDLASPTNTAFFGNGLDRLCAANLGGHELIEISTTSTGIPLLPLELDAA
jgi:gluconolactonase